ncbi:unnamed protein product, partial [Prorocentrum cordatum]
MRSPLGGPKTTEAAEVRPSSLRAEFFNALESWASTLASAGASGAAAADPAGRGAHAGDARRSAEPVRGAAMQDDVRPSEILPGRLFLGSANTRGRRAWGRTPRASPTCSTCATRWWCCPARQPLASSPSGSRLRTTAPTTSSARPRPSRSSRRPSRQTRPRPCAGRGGGAGPSWRRRWARAAATAACWSTARSRWFK